MGGGLDKGTVEITNPTTGDFTYTPFENANGQDSFDFNVSDGQEDDAATVTIIINPENDAPVFPEMPNLVVDEDNTLAIQLLATDVDGDYLTYSVEPVEHIDLYVYNNQNIDSLLMVPQPDWNGTANINLTVDDGNGLSNQASFVLTVNPVDDTLLVAISTGHGSSPVLTTDFVSSQTAPEEAWVNDEFIVTVRFCAGFIAGDPPDKDILTVPPLCIVLVKLALVVTVPAGVCSSVTVIKVVPPVSANPAGIAAPAKPNVKLVAILLLPKFLVTENAKVRSSHAPGQQLVWIVCTASYKSFITIHAFCKELAILTGEVFHPVCAE